eukprot:GHUV01029193.1.p2 GENE.GHUV01029193.1~~GHUV01029193.1.p2  ORF type:complete len:108 (-),score=33.84 GHUV01029193.1:293-616(-)
MSAVAAAVVHRSRSVQQGTLHAIAQVTWGPTYHASQKDTAGLNAHKTWFVANMRRAAAKDGMLAVVLHACDWSCQRLKKPVQAAACRSTSGCKRLTDRQSLRAQAAQ